MRHLLLAAVLPLALAACGADSVWAPDAEVARAAYVTGEPASITLFTVVRKNGGSGAHSGLMIDGHQRVMFDPAGTWHHPGVPERNDVHYGLTPRMRAFYIDYHARETFDVIETKVPVSAAVAEAAIARVQANGAVNKALCGNAISAVLRDLPGFESIPHTFFPGRIDRAFAKLPGAETRVHQDGDPDNNSGVLIVQAREAAPKDAFLERR
ncbi:MAG: hypothetical protein CVT84_00310 [Alphaproteobacteria bacterium HGW-Alphaproteobacteria-6]|nr:MAG: hypothetical protein CVT84_00310 [Alphaproteobacteria bacterium HGW-Alphaproteobacteria-6]